MKKALLIGLMCLFTLNVRAAVWEANQKWSEYWEVQYAQWVGHDVSKNIFVDGKTLLSGLPTDCADSLYAIRILFAYENNLPFVMSAPDYFKGKIKFFGNDTTMFDHIKDERQRVRAFITFIAQEAGTRNLQKDTFPVGINYINSGTLYLVQWKKITTGEMIQHSYFVKGATRDIDLIYYASDAPVAVRTLNVTVGFPKYTFSGDPYGYRAWKHPEHLTMPENLIPRNLGYSTEQYSIINKYGPKAGVLEINRRIKKRFEANLR